MTFKRFSPEILQQVKDRLSLTDIVSKNVTGIKRKGREMWACCPFHHEKSPSFHVKEEQGYYHCFGCGAHGDVFKFTQEIQGSSFMETVEYLAEMAGVKLLEVKLDPEAEKLRNDGMAAMEKAADFYSKSLTEDAKAYFRKRGITQNLAQTFRLGYVEDNWTDLSDHLTQQGFSADVLRETGMTIKSEKGKGDYDRFRGRIMFPIENTKSEVIGFGGRIIGEGEPKYLNSPETPFFNKRYNLYNLNRARDYIYKQKQALVVEGYMDVVGLWKQGIKTAVAPMGTAITESQVQLLWRYNDSPIICMDGDEAGRNAAVRVAKRVLSVLQPGKTLRFAYMPDGEDPDSFVQSQGKEAFQAILADCVSLEDVLWGAVTEGHDIKTGDGRSSIDVSIKELMRDVENPTIRANYQKSLKDRLWSNSKGKEKFTKKQKPITNFEEQARILLSVLFRKPEMLEKMQEKFSVISFEKQEYKELQNIFFRFFLHEGVEKQSFSTYLDNIGMFEYVQNMLKSDVVEQIADENLEKYWLEVYNNYTDNNLINKSNKRKHYRNMALRLAETRDSKAWNKFKEV